MSDAALPPPLPQRDWAQRNRYWFLPLLILTAAGLLLGFVLGIGSLVIGQLKSSPAYVEGVKRARADPEVIAALGQPIEEGWLVMGSFEQSGQDISVKIKVPLSGPRGAAKLWVIGETQGQAWAYTYMRVHLEGGARKIDLLNKPAE